MSEEDKNKEAAAQATQAKAEDKGAVNPELEKLQKQNQKLIADLQAKREEVKTFEDRLTAIEKEKTDREAEEAKKRGEFEKLFNDEKVSKEKQVQDYEQKLTGMKQRMVQSELKALAIKEGVLDPDVVSLIDTKGIKISDELEITGAADAIKAFKELKPNLFAGKKEEQTRATGAATTTQVTGTSAKDSPTPGSKEAKQALNDYVSKFKK